MEQRNVKARTAWSTRSTITDREAHLFYRAVRTIVGAKYTPLVCASKINSANSVTFFVIAVVEYFTDPAVTQYKSVQFDVIDGVVTVPEIKIIGPEQVQFKITF